MIKLTLIININTITIRPRTLSRQASILIEGDPIKHLIDLFIVYITTNIIKTIQIRSEIIIIQVLPLLNNDLTL